MFVLCLEENTAVAALSASTTFKCPNQLPAVIRECWRKAVGEKSACLFFLPLWLAHLNDNVLQSGTVTSTVLKSEAALDSGYLSDL